MAFVVPAPVTIRIIVAALIILGVLLVVAGVHER